MRTHLLGFAVTASTLIGATPALAATLSVGPGQTYAKPCDAIAKASAGDTIEVDAAGDYTGDSCSWTTDDLTVRGINGRAKIDVSALSMSAGGLPGQKGIFTIYAPTATIENFELSGAAIFSDPDPTTANGDDNGAGIRHQGLNLTIRNCYFHDNQDGILSGPLANGQAADGQGEILIEDSEFAHNGAGDGYTHNMYIGHSAKFTLTGCWSHQANVGHLVKTRADTNYILYNRITDEDGTASYEIDVPNGGETYIIGNVIEQGPNTQNPNIITYEEEGMSPTNTSLDLFVVNNSIVNDLGKGTFVNVGGDVTTPVVLENNIFAGVGTIVTQPKATATQTTNFAGDPMFVDQATYDYHLQAGSPCVDKGTTPGMGDGYALTPTQEYVQPISTEGRSIVDVIDIGAYELGGAVDGGAGNGGGTTTGTATTGSGMGGNAGAGGEGQATSGSGAGASVGGTGGGGSSGSPGAKSGCGCGVVGADGGAAPLALLAAIAWMSRRRRRA